MSGVKFKGIAVVANLVSLVLSLIFAAGVANAQELILETVVTDYFNTSIYPKPSVTIITSDELERSPQRPIAEILKQQAGLELLTAGSSGQPSTLFIRGAKSEHTLVLIDGIEVYDSTTTTRSFDLSALTSHNIERIEILRGPQAVRYGSDAIGGVIHIITKRGSSANSQLFIEGGSFQTTSIGAQNSGSIGNLSYSLGGQNFQSQSFSSSRGPGNLENDATYRNQFSARFDYQLLEETRMQFVSRWWEGLSELDFSGGPQGDDPNYESRSQQWANGLKLVTSNLWPDLKSTFSYNINSVTRRYDNKPDAVHTDSYFEKFQSQNQKWETSHRYKNWELGIQQKTESGSAHQTLNGTFSELEPKKQIMTGAFISYDLHEESYDAELGFRHDQLTGFSDSIWNYSFGYKRKWSSDFASGLQIGTGFKAPSFFQLYSNFGTPGLKPERALSSELYIEKNWNESTSTSATIFENQYHDLIDFNVTDSRYENTSRAWTRGLEIQNQSQLGIHWKVKASTMLLSSQDKSTGQSLLRRADQSLFLEVEHLFSSHRTSLFYRWVGSREDLDPVSFERIHLSPYDLVHLQYIYSWTKNTECQLRLENLFDWKYEEIAGFSTAPRSIYLGLLTTY